MSVAQRLPGINWGVGLVVLTLSLIFCAAAYSLLAGYTPWRPGPALSVAEEDLDIGEVWEQSAFPWKMNISNNTNRDVEIERFSASCGCASIEPSSLRIPAHKQAPIHVTLALDLNLDQDEKAFEVNIIPLLKDEAGRSSAYVHGPTFTVHGRTRRLLTIVPRKVSFFEKKPIHGQAFPPATVIVSSRIPLELIEAKCPSSLAIVKVSRTRDNPSQFELNVTPQKLPVGSFQFDLVLEALGKGARYPTARLPVEGVVVPDVQAFPDQWLIGEQTVGERVSEIITLRSNSETPFEVIGIEPGSKETEVKSMSLPGVRDKAFRITQHIAQLGAQSTRVGVLTRNSNGLISVAQISIAYYGVTANRLHRVLSTRR